MGVLRAGAQLNDSTLMDISPGSIGNNPLGADSGAGFATNPVAGGLYAANSVKRGDYFRVLAEFWADGPRSETPPGHWHVLANEVTDAPGLVKRIRGAGPVVNDLEWDVKLYFSLSAATHDAACAAWALKRYYSGPRPITTIRHCGTKGQSSDSTLPSYHSEGLLLESGVVELVTAATSAAGERHELIWDVRTNSYVNGSFYTGRVVVFAWPGEHPENAPAPSIATHQSTVRWMFPTDWLPFQRKTFNTPAFPGYISGHSTFSRAAAEALVSFTGSTYFPGGFGHHTIEANSLQIDLGPSAPVDLQWASFYDAADQAGQSRRWGGIHPSEDDFHGRVIGSMAGISAFSLAEKYWSGQILEEEIIPAIALLPDGSRKISWTALRGMFYKVQSSATLSPAGSWVDETSYAASYDTTGNWTDTSTPGARKFYRILRSAAP